MEGEATRVRREDRSYMDQAIAVERTIGREVLRIETGVLAKQANGAVLVSYGGSAVLVCANTAKPYRDIDFFPLTVDYRERTASAGKFPGGFMKREGRPTDKETLTARCIDRPIRPLFPDGFKDEVQVMANTLSADGEYDPDILAMVGAFASLYISKIPFDFAGGAIRVGMKDDELILMPTYEERDQGDLDLVVAGTMDAVAMVESCSKELPEETLLEAIEFAHEAIQEIASMCEELRRRAGTPKMEVATPPGHDPELLESIRGELWDTLRSTLLTPGKHEQKAALKSLCEQTIERLLSGVGSDAPDRAERAKAIKSAFQSVVVERSRRMVLDEKVRIDGRGLCDVRPIHIGLGLLPRVHGSAVFTRGETQVLASVTLGTQSDEQKVDGIREAFSKRFYLHYNFPPYSVGEVKPIRGPGRREIGHGMLAERALTPVIPDSETFPYTMRLISDVLESNGSSSMGTVCSGSLALMEAGVPLTDPVAGIAMGLISDGDTNRILTDILGEEDHSGDMDFKVAGTRHGVTALQMDIKITGLSTELLRDALEQAREGRLHILDEMGKYLESARDDLHPNAPRIQRRVIPVDKIAALIGPGGRNIRAIQERTETNIEVNDKGEVLISGRSAATLEEAARYVDSYTKEVEMGEEFTATVVGVKDFGAFVELAPGQEALCHISELADGFVERVNDVVDLGDTLRVRVIQIDPSGRIKVSAKSKPEEGQETAESPRRGGRDRGDRGDRGERSERGDRSERGPRGRGRGDRRDRGDRPSRGGERARSERPARGRDDEDRGRGRDRGGDYEDRPRFEREPRRRGGRDRDEQRSGEDEPRERRPSRSRFEDDEYREDSPREDEPVRYRAREERRPERDSWREDEDDRGESRDRNRSYDRDSGRERSDGGPSHSGDSRWGERDERYTPSTNEDGDREDSADGDGRRRRRSRRRRR